MIIDWQGICVLWQQRREPSVCYRRYSTLEHVARTMGCCKSIIARRVTRLRQTDSTTDRPKNGREWSLPNKMTGIYGCFTCRTDTSWWCHRDSSGLARTWRWPAIIDVPDWDWPALCHTGSSKTSEECALVLRAGSSSSRSVPNCAPLGPIGTSYSEKPKSTTDEKRFGSCPVRGMASDPQSHVRRVQACIAAMNGHIQYWTICAAQNV